MTYRVPQCSGQDIFNAPIRASGRWRTSAWRSHAVPSSDFNRVTRGRLYWAKGYSVQSVSSRALDAVRAYLRRQPSHHPEDTIVGWTGDVPEYDNANVP